MLSGGGARGAAHIGVLKVLEELRVPVDVIVGTSMGSIVGGVLRLGQFRCRDGSGTSRRSRPRSLFTDRPPRADLTMRRKADDQTPYLVPELGVTKDGIVLPKGIVTGVSLEGELRKLVQFPTVRSFDQLSIPFRAIATDLGTGEMVVLKDGSLITAMRASMSVPGGMAPVAIGNRQLVDGGLVRNLPVDVARSMGAEIIIAVNLGTPLLRPEQITSVLSVTGQMINILTEQNVRRSLAELTPQDVLIEPELGDFSAGDFDNLTKTVPIGEAGARKVADRLRALSLPPEQYAALRARQGPASTDTMITVVDEIRVEGTQRINPQVVLQSMQTEVGKPIDRDTLDLDLRRIYGRGDFENVGYTVEEVDGKTHPDREGAGETADALRALRPRTRGGPRAAVVLQSLRIASGQGTQQLRRRVEERRRPWPQRAARHRVLPAAVGESVLLRRSAAAVCQSSRWTCTSTTC